MMKQKLKELVKIPTLSVKSQSFIDNYNGEPMPDDIREELTQHVIDSKPFVEAAGNRLVDQFKRVFGK